MGVEVIIYGYGLVCLSMLVFNILYSVYLRSGEWRSMRRTGRVDAIVGPMLGREKFPGEYIARMENLLSRVNDLLAFDAYLRGVPPQQAEIYLGRIAQVFTRLADTYQKREETQSAYFCYFVASWGRYLGTERGKLALKVAQFVQRKSIYCKVNALKALCTLGEEKVLLDALLLLAPAESKVLQIHEKIIIEAFLNFHGDTHKFIRHIWNRFECFPVSVQRVLLDYIRFQSGDYRDNLLRILLDESRDKELHFSAIRYFGRYPDERVREILLRFVSDSALTHWQYAAIAASSLAKYPGSDTVKALTQALSSPNWYVRYNSASSLEQMGFTYEELLGTAASGDLYAREMLTYRLEIRQASAQSEQTREEVVAV